LEDGAEEDCENADFELYAYFSFYRISFAQSLFRPTYLCKYHQISLADYPKPEQIALVSAQRSVALIHLFDV